MLLILDDLLSPDELETITSTLEDAEFLDGKRTAGWHAKVVKQNSQLEKSSPQHEKLEVLVKAALSRHPLVTTALYPSAVHSILFSRYQNGMAYGLHVDNALMGSGDRRYRSDVSWTLFLSEPDGYTGGELVIEGSEGEQVFKLKAGSAIFYPSCFLHQVKTVTDGVRLAAVGWVQSLVRDSQQRDLLFDLDVVRRSLFQSQGKTTEFDLISKTHANLLRQWADP
ncbi:MAG: Fe2+-dependent dioxygenase [Thermosynechococcaceae cyanobacterium MS004]|nr:Fe2+-dependent dioxygenase [Thermosynechococcaceae cyanobacterium MS004]